MPPGWRQAHTELYLVTHIDHHTTVYQGPEAHTALARDGLQRGRHHSKEKVHDLWVDAMQEYCDRHGPNVTVQVTPLGRG